MAARTGKNSKSRTRPRKTAASKTPRRKARRDRPVKSGRVEVRLTIEQKRIVEQASTIRGMTVSSFVTNSVLEDARATIEEEREIKLNAEDSRRVAEAFLNPPAPTKTAVEAAKDYLAGRLRPGF